MSSSNHQATSLYIQQIQAASWKQQIQMLNDLTCQVSLQQLAHSPSVLENIWLPLLHHHNLNVLQHAVAALKIWVEAYGLKNKRIQREILKALIALAKMGRSAIDEDVMNIVATLYIRQVKEPPQVQRVPLSLLDQQRFNSSNNPTFLIGYQQSSELQQQSASEEEIPQIIIQDTLPSSLVLGIISETIKTCKKRAFALCLKILHSLYKRSLLQQRQLDQLLKEADEIRRVIEHRKLPTDSDHEKEAKLAEEITSLVAELKQAVA